jgi:transposase
VVIPHRGPWTSFLTREDIACGSFFLPTYAPETNPIERGWWHLHEEITRNHRCRDIEELLDQVLDWLLAGSCFQFETSIYDRRKAAGSLSPGCGAI